MENINQRPIRYAIVGLGDIAQEAVLPGFQHATNSKLCAFVSGDSQKLEQLGRKYDVQTLCDYRDYDELLSSGIIDAVYISTPNTLHTTYAERALENNIHVLCEKPFAAREEDCRHLINLSFKNNLKLMVAYRLHFDEANLKAIELCKSGKLGDIKIFNSVFSYQLQDKKNIRLKSSLAGGAIWDIGIYCINAARYIFQDEPIEVFAFNSSSECDDRFLEVPEMWSATLRFPNDRLAQFTCSFGVTSSGYYDVVGTKGRLRLNNAYEYNYPMQMQLTIGEKHCHRKFAKKDQFGAEIEYFSRCIHENLQPEPSGIEGLADVRLIEALIHSANLREAIRVEPVKKSARPGSELLITKPPVDSPPLVNATNPSN